MSSIVSFTSTQLPQADQAGGKALSLMTMAQAGLPVPPGFVLTVAFFQDWMATLQTKPEWDAMLNADPETLSETTQAVQSLCATLEFSPEQQGALNEALVDFQAAQPDNHLFAVRSSSPEEDLEGASFAGGYETTLGVTLDTMKDAIRHAFASNFDERVFLYKQEHGFAIDQPRIAVIVQQQLDADSAGVAFSLNPLNNCFDEAVINANFGLGESVVSGEVEPDLFVVDKLNGQIIDTQIGAKETVITLRHDGGTTQATQPRSTAPCITITQVTQLTEMLVKVEKDSHKPVDIEWAFAQEKLYLLQVRPITTYLPLPEEMITPPGSPKRLYADSTLIEQGVQEPLSVLGIDFLSYVLQAMTGPMGGDVDIDQIAFTAGGRYYMNLSHSIKMLGRNNGLAPGSAGDESTLRILDSIDMDQYLPKKLPPKLAASKRMMPFRSIPMILGIMKAVNNPEAFLRKYLADLPAHEKAFETVIDPTLSLDQQATNLTALLRFFFVDYGPPMVMGTQMAQGRIKKLFANEGDSVNEQILSLGMSLPGNITAEMGAMLYEMASSDTVRTHDNEEIFVSQLEQSTLPADFLKTWDQFVAKFGDRCPREIDAATPRPGEQPAMIFSQLKTMAMAASTQGNETLFDTARAKREAAYKTLHAIALKKGKRAAKQFENNYQVLVTLGGQRENGKHYIIKVVGMFRRRALEIAQTFVEAGRLDNPDQIFDLTIADIDKATTDSTLDLRKLGQERTALIDKIKRSHIAPPVIDSRGKAFFPPRKAAAEGELAGTPISPGVVQGRVKVLRTANEKTLLPGEILVTRATDPGWTPLFINAGGIILEIGGALQHGAVVAREYGIPCVSGLAEATNTLKDGQLVEIDGSNGIVRVLDNDK